MQVNGSWTPTIVAFCCNWCSYAGADLSGTNRLSYPANVKIGLEYALTVEKPDGTQTNYSKEMMEKYFKENESSSFELLFDTEEDAQAHIDAYKAAVSEDGDKIYENINMSPRCPWSS